MRRIVKIGFPILCVAVIGGTFILLNKTTERISRNRLKDDDTENVVVEENPDIVEVNEGSLVENTVTSVSGENITQEVKNKNKAIELVKEKAPEYTDCYYTNEDMIDGNYLVAVRDNKTKEAKIYYTVDIQNEKIEIYEK